MMDLLYPKDGGPVLPPALVTLAQNTVVTNQSPIVPPTQVPPHIVSRTSVPVKNPYDSQIPEDDDEEKVQPQEDKQDIEQPSTPPRR
jgi:hypothetical protein